jgi:hypothetical protein
VLRAEVLGEAWPEAEEEAAAVGETVGAGTPSAVADGQSDGMVGWGDAAGFTFLWVALAAATAAACCCVQVLRLL